jgi:dolichyl-phosphate beta-glucosyltransferase
MNVPSLSVVVPAYNEERRLPPTLRRIHEFLEARGDSYEVVVVDDGSTDRTADYAREATEGRALVVRNDSNRGKGFSVRRGMLLAKGARRLMTDADLSTPIEELPRLAAQLDQGADVCIGSRAAAGAQVEVHQSWFRENTGRVFNLAVRLLAVHGISDTQCGFKLFSGPAADAVFGLSRVDGFSFDVEALFLAKKLGYAIREVPVVWRNDAATRVTWSRGALAFLDLLRIRATDLSGGYRRASTDGSL